MFYSSYKSLSLFFSCAVFNDLLTNLVSLSCFLEPWRCYGWCGKQHHQTKEDGENSQDTKALQPISLHSCFLHLLLSLYEFHDVIDIYSWIYIQVLVLVLSSGLEYRSRPGGDGIIWITCDLRAFSTLKDQYQRGKCNTERKSAENKKKAY